MICWEKSYWVIFELGGFLKVWIITHGDPMIFFFSFRINVSNWNMPMLKGNTTSFGGQNKFWGNFWAEEYHIHVLKGQIWFFYNKALESSFKWNSEQKYLQFGLN